MHFQPSCRHKEKKQQNSKNQSSSQPSHPPLFSPSPTLGAHRVHILGQHRLLLQVRIFFPTFRPDLRPTSSALSIAFSLQTQLRRKKGKIIPTRCGAFVLDDGPSVLRIRLERRRCCLLCVRRFASPRRQRATIRSTQRLLSAVQP